MDADEMKAAVRSYAKVNLTLDVLGTRPDGYHGIESVMQTISLHDTVTLAWGGGPGIRITCDAPGIPTDESNLAYKAAALFCEHLGLEPRLEIDIAKRIPAEAGLAGGSSNAAAVLRGLNHLFGEPAGRQKVCDTAAQTGSDVPFFLVGGTALVRGRGEDVVPLPDIPTWWLGIIKPRFGVSTAWAYRRLDEMRGSGQTPARGEQTTASARMVRCIEEEGCERLHQLLSNDLERPALEAYPEIANIKRAFVVEGARGALMCGSGSAVFGLFEQKVEARRATESQGGCQWSADTYEARTITRQEALRIGGELR
jgi:4-diphosphocytidyl-2-C-methyl-D-erythritol kinase